MKQGKLRKIAIFNLIITRTCDVWGFNSRDCGMGFGVSLEFQWHKCTKL